MSKKILIIDDELDIRVLLQYNLEKEGFLVDTAEDGVSGIEKAKEIKPDLILLDVMMPRMDGIETCERLRALSEIEKTFICFLTARGEDYSQIAGLDAGADDYITKPVKPKILISKINAILRRTASTKFIKEDQNLSGIVINRDRYSVHLNNERLVLPKKEFELLALLMSDPGRVFLRDEIMNQVWGSEVIVGDRTIDVHIRKLRKKIGENHIQTVKGVGYKFDNQ